MTARLFSAAELFAQIRFTSLTVQSVVKAVLSCTRANSQGNRCRWPEAAQITVRDVVNSAVFVKETDAPQPIPAIRVVMLLLLRAVTPQLAFMQQIPPSGLNLDAEQVQALLEAANDFLRPHRGDPVFPLLQNAAEHNGFFRGYQTYDPQDLEARLCETEPSKVYAAKRIVDKSFEAESRLLVWRCRKPEYANAGERLYDITALLLDATGQAAAYADIRLAFLPNCLSGEELVSVLNAYDEEGLELGTALNRYMKTEGFDELDEMEFLEEGGILHLQAVEVRQNLRGRGLGARFLRAVLPVATKALRGRTVNKLAMAAQPLKYDFPLQGLTPELEMQALDDTERLRSYLTRVRPQDALTHVKGTDIIYLSTDPRATGSHLERRLLLAESLS